MSDAAEEPAGEPSLPPVEPGLLQADDLRIDIGGTAAITSLTFQARGDRVLLVGGDALMAALTGVPRGDELAHEARIVQGSLTVAGRDVARGDHRGISGRVSLDPAVPASWTVTELLRWHARLGMRSRDSVAGALHIFGFERWAGTKLRALGVAERRAVSIAAACLGDPPVIIIERPLDGLDGEAVPWLRAVIAKASENRMAILSAASLFAGGAGALLGEGASDIIVLRDGSLTAQLAGNDLFAATRRYELTVVGSGDALGDALRTRGIEWSGGPRRYTVTLPDGMGPSEVIAAAAEVRASLVGCMPLWD